MFSPIICICIFAIVSWYFPHVAVNLLLQTCWAGALPLSIPEKTAAEVDGGAGGGEGRSCEDLVLCLATCSTAEQREVASSTTTGRCRNLRAALLHQQMEMLGSGGLPLPSLPITKLSMSMSLHYSVNSLWSWGVYRFILRMALNQYSAVLNIFLLNACCTAVLNHYIWSF